MKFSKNEMLHFFETCHCPWYCTPFSSITRRRRAVTELHTLAHMSRWMVVILSMITCFNATIVFGFSRYSSDFLIMAEQPTDTDWLQENQVTFFYPRSFDSLSLKIKHFVFCKFHNRSFRFCPRKLVSSSKLDPRLSFKNTRLQNNACNSEQELKTKT